MVSLPVGVRERTTLFASHWKKTGISVGKLRTYRDFNGGMDVRFLNEEVIEALQKIREYHFAWDDPKEKLQEKFRLFKQSGLKSQGHSRVYVLTNYWSSIEEDLFRIDTLWELGVFPFVMIYDKQRFVDSRGRWMTHVAE